MLSEPRSQERREPCEDLGRVFLMKGTACAEALRLDHAWCVGGGSQEANIAGAGRESWKRRGWGCIELREVK